MSGQTVRPFNILLPILLIAACLHPLIYINTFSGDAEIHLVYARNFLDGYPLQFNPGQPSSGQTSMGFMFILLPVMKFFGEAATPLAMKMIGLFSLYAIAFQTWRLGGRLGMDRVWSAVAAAGTLLLPGSIYNGMLGSENAFFGALILTWIVLALDSGWLDAENTPSFGRDCLLAVFLGAIFWIRPETIPFGGLAWIARGARDIAAKHRLDPGLQARGLVFGLIAGSFVLAYVLLFRAWTGILPFGAGYARLLESIDVDSIWIGSLAINIKVLQRLAAYAGIVLPALYAVVLSRRVSENGVRWLLIFLGVEFFGLMTAYTFNVVTALHFARYTIFAWPLAILLAVYTLRVLVSDGGVRAGLAVAAILAFLGMAAYETSLRSTFPHDSLTSAMEMQQVRVHASDNLMRQFGNPPMRPVVIAAQEVQERNFIDNRFVIRSLDGILDIVFLNYLCHGYNDHDGYFIDQKVDFLLTPFANYNHDSHRWSLARLEALPVGQSIDRPGIRYTKIDPGIVKVVRLVGRAKDRTIQPCVIGPDSPYY
jgi:hypothetical protein